MELFVEHWASSENQAEVHFFLKDTGTRIYVFGYNPEFISQEQVDAILGQILELKKDHHECDGL